MTTQACRYRIAILAVVWATGSGCQGTIGDDGRNAGTGSTSAAGGAGAEVAGNGTVGGGSGVLPPLTLDSGAVVMRRLSRVEYNNTVRDLLQTEARPADAFPGDQLSQEGFDTVGAVLSVSPRHTESYETAAIDLVEGLFAQPSTSPARQAILVCPLAAGSEAACVRNIFTQFLPRAYRRSVTAEEIDAAVAVVTRGVTAGNTYEASLKAGLEAVLLSPYFLFRVEIDADPTSPEAHPVTDFELATRLSYFLWSSMPDDALFAAAAANKLRQDPTELGRQVSRMLDDPKASSLVSHFASQWLRLSQLDTAAPSTTAFPSYDDALRSSAQQETGLFFQELVKENLPLETFLLGDFTFANARLATQYGIAAPASSGFAKVSLTGTPRIGALTQTSFLMANAHADRTSPVLRGVWVLERLLCSPPPPPPTNLDIPSQVETLPGLTLRQSLEQHRKDPLCNACHAVFDPIGLGFENFDGIGKYRTVDGGLPVDATGVLGGKAFDGPAQLAPLLASDPRFRSCVAQQLLTYGVGRSFAAGDGKMYADAVARHAAADGKAKWRSWIEMIASTEAFQTRRGVAP